jgi:hypothetical protein
VGVVGPIRARQCRHLAAREQIGPSSGAADRRREQRASGSGRSGEDGSAEAAGRPAAQPAARGASVRVAAYPACRATHRFRTATSTAAWPGRGPPLASPRGRAPGLLGPPCRAIQRRLHARTTPRPTRPPAAATRYPEGPGRKLLSWGWAGPGRDLLMPFSALPRPCH